MTKKRNAMKMTTQPVRQPQQPKAPQGLASTVTAAVTSALKALPRGTFAAAGGALAGPKGKAIGRMMSAISGVGDYEVGGPVTSYGGEVPHFTNHPDRTIIKHREFVTNVKSAGTDFTNITYDINPGNSTLFPWLSGVARNYQQYKILGMVVIYKPLTSDYAAGGGMGQVILATNYNVNDLPYESVRQMENSEYAVAVKPSKGALHPVECAAPLRRNDPFYVYDPNADSGAISDKRFYDMGKLQVATEGLSTLADVTIGQLWVTYEIELLKPILPATITPGPGPGPTPSIKYAPNYWDATSFSGTWTANIHTSYATVSVVASTSETTEIMVTLQNIPADTDVVLMYKLDGGDANSHYATPTIETTNFDITATGGDTAQHSQFSNQKYGASYFEICGHAVGRVTNSLSPATFRVIVDKEATSPGYAPGNGWFFIYTPYSSS